MRPFNKQLRDLQRKVRTSFPDWRIVVKGRKLHVKKSQGMNAWCSARFFSLDDEEELFSFLYACHEIEQDLVHVRDELDLSCHLVFTYGCLAEQSHSYFPLFKHICLNVEDMLVRFPTRDEWRSVLLHEVGHYLDHRQHLFVCFSGSTSIEEERAAWNYAESALSFVQIRSDVFFRIKKEALLTYETTVSS